MGNAYRDAMRSLLAASSLLLLSALPAQDLAAKVDSLCQPLVDAGVAMGFVVGVIDGETELVRSYGKLSHDQKDAPTGDTLYEIGSISKVFTGLLLADAVQRGLCKLDDPVQKYLPDDVKLPEWQDRPMLLWHLATHSSGLPRLPDMTGADQDDPYAHFDETRLLLAVKDAHLLRAPGTEYEYSNFGAGLLGFALARMAGAESYEKLLEERITGPLQMRDTAVVLSPELHARLAPPHDADCEPAHTWKLGALAGAGGIRSTVHDMLKLARLELAPGTHALAPAIALSQEKRFTSEKVSLALGWHFARDGVTLWHNGQTGGYRGWFAVVPSRGLAVCLIGNTAASAFDTVAERILQHLFGLEVQPPEVAIPAIVEKSELERLVGTYRMAPGMEFYVMLRERGLFAQLTGQPALRLYPRSPTEFFYRAVEASITFELDGEQVQSLVLHQNGRDVRCRRM